MYLDDAAAAWLLAARQEQHTILALPVHPSVSQPGERRRQANFNHLLADVVLTRASTFSGAAISLGRLCVPLQQGFRISENPTGGAAVAWVAVALERDWHKIYADPEWVRRAEPQRPRLRAFGRRHQTHCRTQVSRRRVKLRHVLYVGASRVSTGYLELPISPPCEIVSALLLIRVGVRPAFQGPARV